MSRTETALRSSHGSVDTHSRDLPRTMLQVLFVGALIAGTFWLLRPFLLPAIWATMTVVATWPLMLRAQAWCRGWRGLAATVMTLALLLVLVAPLTLAMVAVMRNGDRIIGWSRSLATVELPPPPDWVTRIPVVGAPLEARWQDFSSLSREEMSTRVTPYLGALFAWFIVKLGNMSAMLVDFLLTVVIAGILYTRGESAVHGVRRFARRVGGEHGEGIVQLAGQAIRAVALGVVVTALIQSALGGLGLAATRVPFPLILTGVLFILTIAQVGPLPVLLIAASWLFWTGAWIAGTALLVWSILVASLGDFLRPILIKKGADLPLLLIFAGVIGGLIAFGLIGLFIGPVLLAVAYTLLGAWLDLEDRDAAPGR